MCEKHYSPSGAHRRGSVKSLAEAQRRVGRDTLLPAAACAGHTHQTPGRPPPALSPALGGNALQMTNGAPAPFDDTTSASALFGFIWRAIQWSAESSSWRRQKANTNDKKGTGREAQRDKEGRRFPSLCVNMHVPCVSRGGWMWPSGGKVEWHAPEGGRRGLTYTRHALFGLLCYRPGLGATVCVCKGKKNNTTQRGEEAENSDLSISPFHIHTHTHVPFQL